MAINLINPANPIRNGVVTNAPTSGGLSGSTFYNTAEGRFQSLNSAAGLEAVIDDRFLGDNAFTFFSPSLSGDVAGIKTEPGRVYGYSLANPNPSGNAFVQFFNAGMSGVSLGTTVPKMSIAVPASGSVNLAFDTPLVFDTAISVAATKTSNGSGTPYQGITTNIIYK